MLSVMMAMAVMLPWASAVWGEEEGPISAEEILRRMEASPASDERPTEKKSAAAESETQARKTGPAVDPAQTYDLPALAAQARPAVFLLVAYDEDGEKLGSGSSFLISHNGVLVTNRHVFNQAEKGITLFARDNEGKEHRVIETLGVDPKYDLALLRIEGENLPYLKVRAKEGARTGEKVAVIGGPLGLDGTVTDGIVSAQRELEDGLDWVQITAPISPGSSGSPVISDNGEVIGVATMNLAYGQSLNFAVPSRRIVELVKEVVTSRDNLASTGVNAATRDDPALTSDLFAKGRRRLETGAAYAALENFRSLREQFPESSVASAYLGEALIRNGFVEEGLRELQRSVKLNEGNDAGWRFLGLALSKNGKTEEAVRALQRALELNTRDPDSWFQLGRIWERQERMEQAQQALENVSRLDPDNFEAWNRLASIYEENEEMEKTRGALEQAVRIRPTERSLWFKLAEINQEMGDMAGAERATRRARLLPPEYEMHRPGSPKVPSRTNPSAAEKKFIGVWTTEELELTLANESFLAIAHQGSPWAVGTWKVSGNNSIEWRLEPQVIHGDGTDDAISGSGQLVGTKLHFVLPQGPNVSTTMVMTRR